MNILLLWVLAQKSIRRYFACKCSSVWLILRNPKIFLGTAFQKISFSCLANSWVVVCWFGFTWASCWWQIDWGKETKRQAGLWINQPDTAVLHDTEHLDNTKHFSKKGNWDSARECMMYLKWYHKSTAQEWSWRTALAACEALSPINLSSIYINININTNTNFNIMISINTIFMTSIN